MSTIDTSPLAAADLFSVKGLVAVVTGGATGIGLMIAKALEENGAKVYIIGRRREVLEKAAKDEAKQGNIIPITGDITSKADLERITSQITKEVGYINLLVANAGISGPRFGQGISVSGANKPSLVDLQRDLWSVDPVTFSNTFSVNVGGVFFSIVAFLPLLSAGNDKGNVAQKGQVVIISSIGSFSRVPGAHYAYGASKAAATHMAKQFASTFVDYGIRFNVIAPGMYPSEMTAQTMAAVNKMTDEEKAARLSPLGRMGQTQDMAGCILWLASRAGEWLNGNVIVTDGGRLSVMPSTY